MPINKVSGIVASNKTAYYCSTYVPVTTHRITFGSKRTIKSTIKELSVRRNRCIKYSEQGRKVNLECNQCHPNKNNKAQSCGKKDDEIQDVYIL